MEEFSALLAICAGNSPVTGEFPAQRPVTRSFDVFFDLRLKKRLSKESWGWWSETPSLPLWRHSNAYCHAGRFPGMWQHSHIIFTWCITMTSQWARLRLKSPASRLFTQPFIQGVDHRKHQSSASLAFVRGIHRGPVNSPHKWSVTRKMFPFDDVIMYYYTAYSTTMTSSERQPGTGKMFPFHDVIMGCWQQLSNPCGVCR